MNLLPIKKIKFVEVNYHFHNEFSRPEDVIAKHFPSNLFAQNLQEFADITLVKHLNFEGGLEKDGIAYRFFKRNNRFTQLPSKTHKFIKELEPDIILVQGFIFPIQVMFLRRAVGKKSVIVLQHQGEQPAGKKLHFQKIADRFVNGYIFSSLGNAEDWLKTKVIRKRSKCFEMPSSSTNFSKLDKNQCRQQLNMKDEINFLWVGRLNENKDPMTVLKAMDSYFRENENTRLWMLYSEEDMISEIRNFLDNNRILREKVELVGKRPHDELQTWFSAADYYISASHREGGSYALTEAMACGCIPIVSKIPAAMDAIDNGHAGFYFEVGDSEGLEKILQQLDPTQKETISEKVIGRFNNHLSPQAVAKRLLNIYNTLKSQEMEHG